MTMITPHQVIVLKPEPLKKNNQPICPAASAVINRRSIQSMSVSLLNVKCPLPCQFNFQCVMGVRVTVHLQKPNHICFWLMAESTRETLKLNWIPLPAGYQSGHRSTVRSNQIIIRTPIKSNPIGVDMSWLIVFIADS